MDRRGTCNCRHVRFIPGLYSRIHLCRLFEPNCVSCVRVVNSSPHTRQPAAAVRDRDEEDEEEAKAAVRAKQAEARRARAKRGRKRGRKPAAAASGGGSSAPAAAGRKRSRAVAPRRLHWPCVPHASSRITFGEGKSDPFAVDDLPKFVGCADIGAALSKFRRLKPSATSRRVGYDWIDRGFALTKEGVDGRYAMGTFPDAAGLMATLVRAKAFTSEAETEPSTAAGAPRLVRGARALRRVLPAGAVARKAQVFVGQGPALAHDDEVDIYIWGLYGEYKHIWVGPPSPRAPYVEYPFLTPPPPGSGWRLVELKPGQGFFIPAGWQHAVLNSSDMVSASFEVVPGR